uniref:Uncharacterized protein n=1 Tax=Macrostomum lignano TaxID=282301 RepID=A0A1I8FQ19_9PLAT
MAVVSSCDPCVRTRQGSDGATSCLVLVLRRISNGDTCMLKYDGCGAGRLHQDLHRTHASPVAATAAEPSKPPRTPDWTPTWSAAFRTRRWKRCAHSPATSCWRCSPRRLSFICPLACVAHVNSRVIDDTAYPIIQDRGPWAALRGARFLSSQSGPACVYDSGLPQRLVIEPFSYRQPQAGGLSLDFLISMPDDK